MRQFGYTYRVFKIKYISHYLYTLFFFLTFFNAISQQDPKVEIQDYTSKNNDVPVNFKVTAMGNSKGLNSSDIFALYQDKNGFVWVGTQSGLSRFDGYEFKNFTKTENTFLGQIHSIEEDSTGTLWVGGVNGLFFYKNGGFHKTTIGKKDIQVVHFGNNKMWIGGFGFIPFALSSSDLLKLKNGEQIQIYPIVNLETWKKKIGRLLVRSIDTDQENRVWLGLYNRRASFDGNQLNVYWKGNSVTHEYSAVKAINKDSIFWGSEDTGLILQTNNESTQLTKAPAYIFASTESSTYFLTTQKLLELKNGQLHTLHTFSTYSNLYFKEMIVDREGNFWIGAEGNLLKLTPSYFNTWSFSSEPLLHSSHSITQLSNRKILIGSSKEKILTLKNDKFNSYTTIDAPHNSVTGAIYQDKNNWIWYATSMGGLILERNGKKEIYTEKDGLGDKGQFLFYNSSSNELWSGGENGITHIIVNKNGKVSFDNFMVKLEGERFPLFRAIFESPDKSIWAVGNKGLFVLKDKKLKQWNFPSSITPSPIITNSVIDSKGQLWLSTQGEGLWQCGFNKNNEPVLIRQWSMKDGLPSNVILDILIDKSNRIWISSQNNICSLNLEKTSPTIRCFDEIDGWLKEPTSHCRLMESDDGYLWAVGLTEISSFPLYQLPQNKVKPYTFISQVQLFDGNEDIYLYSQNTSENKQLPEKLILPYTKNFLSFHFTTTSYTKSEKNRFKYKLIGLDPKWNNSINSKKVLYSGLQPGEYTFTVLAANNDNIYGSKPANFSFIILSPWYKKWWAYTLYGLTFFSVVIVLYRFNLNRKLAVAEKQKTVALDNLKSKMYANISHEFRTPLTLINGLSKVLMEEDLEAENVKKLKGIYHNGNQLLHLVNQMLELISFDANKITASYKNADVIQFIEKCISFYKFYGDSKGQQVLFETTVSSLKMDFDDDKLQKTLNNILSNAIKFTPYGGIIEVKISTRKESLIITISDNGNGIASEDLPFVFERYYKTFDKDNNVGNGIGMALTKELVTLLKGTIRVASKQGEGTIFTVELPIQNKIKTIEKVVLQIPFIDNISNENVIEYLDNEKGTYTILLVEDNKEIQNFVKLILGNLYTIYTANNGIEGLEITKNRNIDFIISDVMMPEMDGFEFCKHIKNDVNTSHIPFIIISARTTTEDKLKGYKLGIDAYLFKPFDKDELLLIIKNLLHKKQEQIVYFSKLLGLKSQQQKSPGINLLDVDFIKSIQEIALLPEKVSIDEITQNLSISRTQLHKKVKALTGKSITHYINHVRIEKAKTLLKESNLQINEIAFELGFESANYFIRIFKKVTGITPIAYREKPHFKA